MKLLKPIYCDSPDNEVSFMLKRIPEITGEIKKKNITISVGNIKK